MWPYLQKFIIMHAYRQIYRTLVPQYINSVLYYDLFEPDQLYDECMWKDTKLLLQNSPEVNIAALQPLLYTA